VDLALKVASAVGLILLVGAYLLNRRGVLGPLSKTYLLANGVGAGLLAVYSWWIQEWVFVALEGFWSVVSFWPLVRRSRDQG